MKDVFTTKVSTKGGEDGGVSQDVEMVSKSIAINYKPQDNKGKLGGDMPFEWDIAANKIIK
jgi:type VI protein secretion system component Hcp